MKIQPGIPPKQFTPITITLETEDEVAKLFALFNFVPIVNQLILPGWSENLENVNDRADNPPIDYVKYHLKLNNMSIC